MYKVQDDENLLIFTGINFTHTGSASRGPMVSHLLEVDGVDGAVDALLAPQSPCWLLEHTTQWSTHWLRSYLTIVESIARWGFQLRQRDSKAENLVSLHFAVYSAF